MNEQNQKRMIAIFFAKFKGELFQILNSNKMETPKKTPAQIRQKTAKRKVTARPPIKTPNMEIKKKGVDPMSGLWDAFRTSRFK